jgi:hypothetical protein
MMNEIEYQLNYDRFGNKRKYKLNKKKRLKIIDNNSWLDNDLRNQWIYRDYKSYYIVISMYKSNQYTVTLSGYKIKTIFKDLDKAKLASLRFCDKLLK